MCSLFVMPRRRSRPVARADSSELSIQDQIDAAMPAGPGFDLTPWDLPPVIAARRLYASTVSQLPFVAFRDGQPRADQPRFLSRPNDHETFGDMLNRAVNQLMGWGHVWLLPLPGLNPQWPDAVEVIDAANAAGEWDSHGRLVAVNYAGSRRRVGSSSCPILIPFDIPAAGSPGVTPFQSAWKVLTYAAALYQLTGSFFEAGTPSMAIEVPQRISEIQAISLKRQTRSWRRSHEPVIIDADAKIRTIGSTPLEMQLVEMCSWAVAEVARVVNIPPSLLNAQANDSMTYQNGGDELRRWKSLGLGEVVHKFEAAFSQLLPHGTTAVADYSELFRPNDQERYETLALADWLTADEKRGREGLPPLGGAAAAIADPAPTLSVVGGTPDV